MERFFGSDTDLGFGAGAGEFDGVAQEVAEALGQGGLVAQHGGQVGVDLDVGFVGEMEVGIGSIRPSSRGQIDRFRDVSS